MNKAAAERAVLWSCSSDRSQQKWQNVCRENKEALHRLWGLHITELRI